MELLVEANIIPQTRLADLQQEAGELTAILTTCSKKAKRRRQQVKNEGKRNQEENR